MRSQCAGTEPSMASSKIRIEMYFVSKVCAPYLSLIRDFAQNRGPIALSSSAKDMCINFESSARDTPEKRSFSAAVDNLYKS